MTPPPAPGRHDPLGPFRGVCRSCRAEILWADTTAGERMPINHTPAALGNVLLQVHPATSSADERLTAGVLTRAQAAGAAADGVNLYQSHFATCPHASGHRRSRSKTRRWRRT